MKKFLMSLGLMVLLSSNVFAGRSVDESVALQQLFAKMTEVASESPSLAFFGYEEYQQPFRNNCMQVPSSHIGSFIYFNAKEMGIDDQNLINQALNDISLITGSNDFQKCDTTEFQDRGIINYTEFINDDYIIRFELRYED